MRYAVVVLLAACYVEPDPPVLTNYVFVTSETRQANAIDGLAGGDAICNAAAKQANLPGTFVAWLSDGTITAPARLGNARAWYRPDHKPFADKVSDILAGRIYYPLAIDENGDDIVDDTTLNEQIPVVTGTTSSGLDARDCNNFTGQGTVEFGVPDGTSQMWTAAGEVACGEVSRLYCFGIDLDGTLEVPHETGRRIFITSGDFAPGPTASPDATCNAEAAAAGVAGTFAAVIGISGPGTIADRFAAPGLPWVRPDGVVVTSDFKRLEAPINVTLAGDYVGQTLVWGGAQNLHNPSNDSETCGGTWQQTTGAVGIVGTAPRSDKHAVFVSTGAGCDESKPIYCAEL